MSIKENKAKVKKWVEGNLPQFQKNTHNADTIIIRGDLVYFIKSNQFANSSDVYLYNKNSPQELISKEYTPHVISAGVASSSQRKEIEPLVGIGKKVDLEGSKSEVSTYHDTSHKTIGKVFAKQDSVLEAQKTPYQEELSTAKPAKIIAEEILKEATLSGVDPVELLKEKGKDLTPAEFAGVKTLIEPSSIGSKFEEGIKTSSTGIGELRTLSDDTKAKENNLLSSLLGAGKSVGEGLIQGVGWGAKQVGSIGSSVLGGLGKVYNNLTDKQKEETSLDQLSFGERREDYEKLKAISDDSSKYWGDIFKGHRDQIRPENMDFSVPTRTLAEELFNKEKPEWEASNMGQFADREQALTAGGHGIGSSSRDNLQDDKNREIQRQRNSEIDHRYQGLLQEHQAKGNLLGYIQSMDKSGLEAGKTPLDIGARDVDSLLAQIKHQQEIEHNRRRQEILDAKALETQNIQNQISIATARQNLAKFSSEERSSIKKEIFSFYDAIDKIQNNQFTNEIEKEKLLLNILQNKEAMAVSLEKLGLEKEALKLKKIEIQNNKDASTLNAISEIAGLAVKVAMIA